MQNVSQPIIQVPLADQQMKTGTRMAIFLLSVGTPEKGQYEERRKF